MENPDSCATGFWLCLTYPYWLLAFTQIFLLATGTGYVLPIPIGQLLLSFSYWLPVPVLLQFCVTCPYWLLVLSQLFLLARYQFCLTCPYWLPVLSQLFLLATGSVLPVPIGQWLPVGEHSELVDHGRVEEPNIVGSWSDVAAEHKQIKNFSNLSKQFYLKNTEQCPGTGMPFCT